MARENAHEIVRRCAMKAHTQNITLRDSLLKEDEVRNLVTDEELEEALKPENYLGRAEEIVDEVVNLLSRRYK